MTIFSRSSIYLAAIFLFGLATGGIIGLTVAKRQMMKPVNLDTIGRTVKQELTDKLALDAVQQAKIDPLVDQSMARIQVIYFDTLKRIDGVLLDQQQYLIKDLRPDQIAKLSTIAKSREEFIRRHNPMETPK